MKLTGIKYLKPGNKIKKNIYSTKGQVLLPEGAEITSEYIEKLKKLKIYAVYVEDEMFTDLCSEEILPQQLSVKAITILENVHNKVQKGSLFDEYEVKDLVKEIVEEILMAKDKNASLFNLCAVEKPLYTHLLNTCILSLMLGKNLGYDYGKLCDLGVGAILHDIELTSIEHKDESHVEKGFETMKRYKGFSSLSNIAVYSHHEKVDGTGYPRGFRENQIHKYAQIVSIASTYDKLVNNYLHIEEEAFLPHEAIEKIFSLAGKDFDSEMIFHFKNSIHIYPIGLGVKINKAIDGIVIAQNSGMPERPIIGVIKNKEIKKINLVQQPTLFITEVVGMK